MPMFEYTARNTTGQIQKGQLDVATREDVTAHLRKNRLILVSVREAPKQIKLSIGGGGRIKTRDVVIFTRQFATMINSGLPLVQSLNILAQQVTHISGRGVGMDVVRTNVERYGGTVDPESTLGVGTTFRIRLLLTLAIIPALLVRS